MIFVALGTQDKSFVRLLEILQTCIHEKWITDEVVVQAGYTQFHCDAMKILDYTDRNEYNRYLNDCDLLITHGGVGTIMTALSLDKKVIAMPRLAQYGEHHNDHQREIIDSFCEKGYILACNNLEEMQLALQQVNKFTPEHFVSNQKAFLELMRREIGI